VGAAIRRPRRLFDRTRASRISGVCGGRPPQDCAPDSCTDYSGVRAISSPRSVRDRNSSTPAGLADDSLIRPAGTPLDRPCFPPGFKVCRTCVMGAALRCAEDQLGAVRGPPLECDSAAVLGVNRREKTQESLAGHTWLAYALSHKIRAPSPASTQPRVSSRTRDREKTKKGRRVRRRDFDGRHGEAGEPGQISIARRTEVTIFQATAGAGARARHRHRGLPQNRPQSGERPK